MYSNRKKTTILIADDHELFNDGLFTLLMSEDSPYQVIDQVFSGSEVITALQKGRPDILLLDINLPNRNGLDIARQVVREFPQVRIIILSMYSYQKFVDEGKAIGVSGYLLKSASRQELLTCLQRVTEGIPYFDPKLNDKSGLLHENDEFVKRYKITPRELEIIVLIKMGLATPEIAERLFLSLETVKTHRKNIYYKLGINNLAELIQFATEHGL